MLLQEWSVYGSTMLDPVLLVGYTVVSHTHLHTSWNDSNNVIVDPLNFFMKPSGLMMALEG